MANNRYIYIYISILHDGGAFYQQRPLVYSSTIIPPPPTQNKKTSDDFSLIQTDGTPSKKNRPFPGPMAGRFVDGELRFWGLDLFDQGFDLDPLDDHLFVLAVKLED